ncbi:MAG: hypothetical protein GX601_19200 [Anaerolineales bacterium]|nr:hypothetical protein [Anaerolineales bacterium]
MEVHSTKFLFALTRKEREVLRRLARLDGVTSAGTLRRLLRREARERGLLVDSDPDGGQAGAQRDKEAGDG